jgi:hypothetical protein
MIMRHVAIPIREPEPPPRVARRVPVPAADPINVVIGFVRSVSGWVFGAGTLWLALAVLSAVPLGQFLVLGYLLEACGRVARSGRLKDGFVGVRTATRFGGAAVGCVILWLPLYGLSVMADSARIIDPMGRGTRLWENWLTLLATLYALHVIAALLRGGRLRDFARPLNVFWLGTRCWRGGLLQEARDGVWSAVGTLRLPYYFWLGARGYAGGLLWLLIPLTLLGLGHRVPAVGVLGGFMLGLVVVYLPFLQTRFARDNRFRGFRMLGAVRATYRRAPLAFAVALSFHLLAAMPLYLMKIELIPRDLAFLEGLVFLGFIFPARLLDGWAYARAARRDSPRHWVYRWAGRLAVIPVVVAYVLVVFSSQHLGWSGISSLYEQHAFLLPVPFVSWDWSS